MIRWGTIIVIAQLFFSLSIWASIVAQIVIFSFRSVIIHFTNFSLEWLATFLLLTTAAFIEYRPGRLFNVRMAGHVVACCFLPLLQTIFFVATSVYVLLLLNSFFIEKFFDTIGVGEVVVANSVKHFDPIVAILFFALAQRRLVVYGHRLWLVPLSRTTTPYRRWKMFALLTYWTFAGGTLAFVFYLLFLNPLGTNAQIVYSVHVPHEMMIVGNVAMGLVVNGIALCTLEQSYGLTEPIDSLEYEELMVRYTEHELKHELRLRRSDHHVHDN